MIISYAGMVYPNRFNAVVTSRSSQYLTRAFRSQRSQGQLHYAARTLRGLQAAVRPSVRHIEEVLGVRLFELHHQRVTLHRCTGTRGLQLCDFQRAFRDIDSTLRER
jgi:hypothetical protein